MPVQTGNGKEIKRGARVRTCAGCGRKEDKAVLMRIVRTPSGEVLPDPEGKRNGRGAYLCRNRSCLAKAQKRKSLERSLKAPVPPGIYDMLLKVTENE